MSDVKRYGLACATLCNCDGYMQEKQSGDYASYADYLILQSERDRLKAENEMMREALKFYADQTNHYYTKDGTKIIKHALSVHTTMIENDFGNLARQALNTEEGR